MGIWQSAETDEQSSLESGCGVGRVDPHRPHRHLCCAKLRLAFSREFFPLTALTSIVFAVMQCRHFGKVGVVSIFLAPLHHECTACVKTPGTQLEPLRLRRCPETNPHVQTCGS